MIILKAKRFGEKSATLKWFTAIFFSFSLILFLALIPLYLYLQNTFSALELEKTKKQLLMGTSQLDALSTSMLNVSQALNQDSRFLVFRYANADYTRIDVVTQNQMRTAFQGLTADQPLTKDSALQFGENIAITPHAVFFDGHTAYYPDFFQCDALSYPQWDALLEENGTGFLPICHIRTVQREYDALVYALCWTEHAYLYACIDLAELKDALVLDSRSNESFFTLRRTNGDILFSDLPEGETGYRTISSSTAKGELEIEVHIPNAVFYEKVRPVHLFLSVYTLVCLAFFIIWALVGSHVSARPISRITGILEKSHHLVGPSSASPLPSKHRLSGYFWKDFDRITNSIAAADLRIDRYRSTIDEQQEILTMHFFEKAIHGRLGSQEDIAQFHAHFPDFPHEYRLLMLKFYAASPESAGTFSNELLTVRAFLQSVLPSAYLQPFGPSELLLLIPNSGYQDCERILNFLMANINQEEPLLILRCTASDSFTRPEDLSHAYYQLQDLECCSFSTSTTHICTTADCADTPGVSPSFYMVDLQTLYSTVSYGNESAALLKLEECSTRLESLGNPALLRHIYELIRSMLVCVKMEHPEISSSAEFPDYCVQKTLYQQLESTMRSFCREIRQELPSESDRFAAELVQYIDQHFTEYDLCLDSLGKHFNCSVSKLQKTVKSATGMTTANYIEKKRMDMASVLLAQQVSVTQAAEKCGYASTNSFYKAYKRYYGKSPTNLS